MFIWYWTQDSDPSFMLNVPTKAQIESWNDTCWWTPEFDKLYTQQNETIDVAKRIPIAQQAQQIAYQATPYVIFAYPNEMEAYRGDRWTGVVMSPSDVQGYDGSAFYNYENVDTYRYITETAKTGATGANNTVLIVVGVVAAILVIGGVVVLVRRRSARSVEE